VNKLPHVFLAALLAVGLSFAVAGCRTFKLFPGSGTDDKSGDANKGQDERTTAAIPRPGKYSLRVAPYVFLSDFELKPEHPLFKELAGLRDQVYKELRLPSAETPVYVYLFEDVPSYEKYMKARYPKLPKRRAFFVAQPHAIGGGEDLLIFTSWGDRIQQDLRHELTHALLHSVIKTVPLWLDEGLAEYFELPPDRQGVNEAHLAHIRWPQGEGFHPDLARLERLEQVEDMKPAEYREAWAWVHLMLRGKVAARPVLLAYLQQLRQNANPPPLRPRLATVLPGPEETLGRYVRRLDPPGPGAPAAPAAPSSPGVE
jgi:hypothetical protein